MDKGDVIIIMVKIDIISGFLGAGKTTLIKKLLQDAFKGQQVVLIENEFGEIGIDGGFLKDAGIEIKEMNSGCICCSLVGDFGTSLREVIETYAPERILIEPSGVGKLSDVLKAVDDVAVTLNVQVNSAVAVVDASKAKMYIKNFGEFFINQIAYAGTIILSRTDKVTPEKLEECVALIREHNQKATIITTPLEQLDGKAVLETIEGADSLDEMMKEMLERARAHRDAHTYVATNYEEFKETINTKPGFVKAMWCGNRECEDKIKEDVQATSRCMPFEQEHLSDVCVCCGKPAKKMVYWGRAY